MQTLLANHAQDLVRFEHPINIGLEIHGFIQDRDGFFWIGATGGLIRYDGNDLKFYRKGPDSLSGNMVPAVLEDRDRVLWIGTNEGLNKFDRETNTFTWYKHDPDDPSSLSDQYVRLILEDRNGVLWIGTGNGLNRFDKETGTYTRYNHDPGDPASLGGDNVYAIFEDSVGTLWVGTQKGGLDRFDRDTGGFAHYTRRPNDPSSLSNNYVTAITEDELGTLWVGTGGGGMNAFDRTVGTFTRYTHDADDPTSLGGDSIQTIYKDKSGVLWVGCFQGALSKFDRETHAFIRYQHDPGDHDSLTAGAVRAIHEDHSGILWIVFIAGQIDKYDRKANRFKLYRHDPNIPDSLSSDIILPIYEDLQGIVWVGTGTGGLNRFNRDTETFIHYTHDPNDPDSLPSSFVTAIFEDSKKVFWVATSDSVKATFSLFDRTTGKCEHHYVHDPNDPDSLAAGRSIRSIIQDRDDPNILWLTVHKGGLERFDKRRGTFSHYAHDPTNVNSLGHNAVWQIYEDDDGTIWITNSVTACGIERFDKQAGTFVRYAHNPKDLHSPSSDIVYAVFEDSSGVLWFSTDNGFNSFDRETERFRRYTTRDGLPDNVVYGILEDDAGYFWMGTNRGLVRFDPVTERFKVYGKNDGLQGDAFLSTAYARTHNGEMWFGGLNGVNRFHPEKIMDNPHIPTIVLTAIKQGGEKVDFGRDSTRLKEIELDWQHNFFEFEFAALEYTQPEKNQYAYMLEGFDNDWYHAGTRNFGRYSNLPGREYTLRLKGSNSDGVWNNKGMALKITVTRPFWEVVLRESEERFRSLVEVSSDWIWEIDDQGVYTYASPKIEDILGYEPVEVIGKTPFDLMPPDEAERVTALFEYLVQQREPIVRLKNVNLHKDGRLVMLETNGVPIFDKGQNLLGYRGIDRDITARKRAEEERERLMARIGEQARRTQQIIDTVPEGVLLLDDDGRVILANPVAEGDLCVLAGAKVGDTLTHLGDRSLNDLLTSPPKGLWHQVETDSPSPRIFEVIARPIENGPSPGGWVLVIRDVTQERDIDRRIRQQERLAAVGQLAAGIAHDFNNILATVVLYAQMTARMEELPDRVRERMLVINQQAQHATKLIRQILDFSRSAVLEQKPLDLALLLREQINILDRTLPESIQVTLVCGVDEYTVNADPTRIQQAVMNLAVNARDAMPDGGVLRIELDRVDDVPSPVPEMEAGVWTRITVSDTGTGIPDDVLEHIFEPFYTTKAPGEGSGLGLAQVHGIVGQHEGRINVETQVGRGTTFSIYLPALPVHLTESFIPELAALPQGRGETVLVVEDGQVVRQTLVESLDLLNYQVLEAASGREALKVLEQHGDEIALVLSDVVMPEMGGIRLFHTLKQKGLMIPVILMTGHPMENELKKLHGQGLSGWLLKPPSEGQLARLLAQVLGERPSLGGKKL